MMLEARLNFFTSSNDLNVDSLIVRDDCRILVETSVMMVIIITEIKTSIRVNPWVYFCSSFFNKTLSYKYYLLAFCILNLNRILRKFL